MLHNYNVLNVVIDIFAALTATAELQIVDIGAVAVHLQASKNATFRCKLNDEQFVTCK